MLYAYTHIHSFYQFYLHPLTTLLASHVPQAYSLGRLCGWFGRHRQVVGNPIFNLQLNLCKQAVKTPVRHSA